MTESLKRCLDLGINFFDTAEFYGAGDAEFVLGNTLREIGAKREELVISTKLFWGAGKFANTMEQFNYYKEKGLNCVGLSRKHIIEGARASLKRLQLD